ncbi:MAG: hypothetical protein NZ899_05445 [Thermoguttaceae bacterium]|nr:hypothetical protein [Thermoguttaceae bacterium]MDW8078240.1 hypothetical protein [Thermoguttaceae bacterium]
MKFKFDLSLLTNFLIHHGEKLVVGVVGLVFLWCLVRAVSTAGNTVDFSPDQLRADAQSAQQHIEQTNPSATMQPTDYVVIARRIRDKIDDTYYRHPVLWDPPLWERRGLRGEPAVFGLEKIRAVAGNGVFNMADPTAPPTSAAAGASSTRGQRWVVVTGLIPIARQVEAYKEIFKEALYRDPQRDYPLYLHYWVERAEVTPRSQPGQLRWVRIDPRLMYYHFCRLWRGASQEVVHPAYIPRVAPGGMPLVFPLGPRVGEMWGPEVAFPPEIPLASAMRGVPGAPGVPGYPAEMAGYPGMPSPGYPGGSPAYPGMPAYPGAGEMYSETGYPGMTMPYPGSTMTSYPGAAPGMPGIPMPGAPGGSIIPPLGELPGLPGLPVPGTQPGTETQPSTTPQPGQQQQPAASTQQPSQAPTAPPTSVPGTVASAMPRLEVKYQLFRFFDFTVEPGKQYVYRVQLVLFNPNYRLDPQYLERPELAEQPWLETQWSEATEPVWVPMDARVVVGPVKPAPTVMHEPAANVVILAFRAEDGLRTYQDFTLFRGQLANLEGVIVKTGLRPGMAYPGSTPYGPEGLEGLYMPEMGGPPAGGPPSAPGAPGAPPGGRPGGPPGRPGTAQKTEQEEKFLYKTEMLVVDIAGGERLHRTESSMTVPGELLVMDPNGTLLVLDELSHQFEYKLYHKEPEQPARRPGPGRPGEPGSPMAELPEDYYMYTPEMMEYYETGRPRGARGRGRTGRTPAGMGSPGRRPAGP